MTNETDFPISLSPWGVTAIKASTLLLLGALCGLTAAVFLNPSVLNGATLNSHDIFIVDRKSSAQQATESLQLGAAGHYAGPRGPPGLPGTNATLVNLTAAAGGIKSRVQQQLEQLQQLLHHAQLQLHDVVQQQQQEQEQRQKQQQTQQQQQQQQQPVQAAAQQQQHEPQQQGQQHVPAARVWPTDGIDPTGNTCHDGFLAGPRSIFWPWVDDASPGLADVFHAEDRVYAVFNLKIPSPHREQWEPRLSGNWSIEFYTDPALGLPNTTVHAYDLGRDGHGHTFTLTVPLPAAFESHPRDRSLRINIIVQHSEGQKRYDNVPLCLHPEPVEFRHLVACTELTAGVADAVPEWVVYHHLQGVEHTYLYINDDLQKVRAKLEPLVKGGLATVVDWQWPERYNGQHMFQQAEQNGCLMRMRGQARWVILHDVDEFIQPMQPGSTLADLLNQRNVLDNVGSLILHGLVWGSHANESVQANITETGGNLMLGRYRTHGGCCDGSKMIANPRGLSYNSVHHITTGGPQQELDTDKEARINHFKPGSRSDVLDDSLWAYTGSIQNALQELGYPPP